MARIFIPPRYKVVLAIVVFFLISLMLFGSPTNIDHVPTYHEVSEKIKNPNLPSLPNSYNPFAPTAHKPPVQANSSSGETTWFSDWKWQNPFSSSITLDENRAVLPPLRPRQPIYTFYDGDVKQNPVIREAEEQLLLQWRRAWWAKGFKPVVLGRGEAMNNPLYKTLQLANLKESKLLSLETEVARWLAWGNMGSGIMANWLTLPMAPYDDPFLVMLRRGEYPKLTRYEPLRNGLFVGEKDAINAAAKAALNDPVKLKKASDIVDAIPQDMWSVEKQGDAIAFYDRVTIKEKYKDVEQKLGNKANAEGLKALAQLINAHLHNTWQSTFEEGVAVVKPVPAHMTALTEEAIDIARNLTQCSESPMPATHPPNRNYKPCVASTPMKVTILPTYRNHSTLFNIGTVPHPYTFLSLNHQRDTLDARFLRREVKERNLWLTSATKELLGSGKSASMRITHFKDAVASERNAYQSLWLTAERESQKDLNWIFGFNLPNSPPDDGKSETPVPGPERRPPPPKPDGPVPTEQELGRERELLRKARDAIKSKVRDMVRVKEAVEAWNIADAEAWRFTRAFSARRRMERLVWEEEESKFAGAERRKGSSWGRWFDKDD